MSKYKQVFESVTADARYLANLDWGKARSGHPEGTVRDHIAEIEKNIDALRPKLSDEEYWKLKILVHVHDSFKAESKRDVPILDLASHASIAREFLAQYCDDADLLNMVQYHDEPYALYRQFGSKGSWNQERFNHPVAAIEDWSLFLAFQIIDGCTMGKGREPLHWFFSQVGGLVPSNFTSDDIIP